MAAAIGLATWFGWEIDQYLNLGFPIFTLTLVTAAIVALIYKMIKLLADNE